MGILPEPKGKELQGGRGLIPRSGQGWLALRNGLACMLASQA